MAAPKMKASMIRVRRVFAPNLAQIEGEVNAALAAMEEAGQHILSVQFAIPQGAAGEAVAFIVYDAVPGVQKHNEGVANAAVDGATERLQGADREQRTKRNA